MCFGIVWRQAQSFTSLKNCAFEIPGLGESICQVDMGLGEVRLELHGRAELGDGRFKLPL